MGTYQIRAGQFSLTVELSDEQLNQVKKLSSTKTDAQVEKEFEAVSLENKQEVAARFKTLTDNHNRRLSADRQKVNSLQVELAQVSRDQKRANDAGSYTLAIELNARRMELDHLLEVGQLALLTAKMETSGERMNFLNRMIEGPLPMVGGVDYRTYNQAKLVLATEFYQGMAQEDVAYLLKDQAQQAANEFGSARLAVADAQEALERHQAAAQGKAAPDGPLSPAVSEMYKRWGIKPTQPAAPAHVAAAQAPANSGLEQLNGLGINWVEIARNNQQNRG